MPIDRDPETPAHLTLSKSQATALRRLAHAERVAGNAMATTYTRRWRLMADRFGFVEADKPFRWDVFKRIDCGSFPTMRALVRKGLLSETLHDREEFGKAWTSPRNPGRRFAADDAEMESVSFALTDSGRAWLIEQDRLATLR